MGEEGKKRNVRLGLDSVLQQLQVRHDFVPPWRHVDVTDGIVMLSGGADDSMEVRRGECKRREIGREVACLRIREIEVLNKTTKNHNIRQAPRK